MLDVKLLPCKEIRAWRKGKDELCDANAMVKCDIRIENQSSDAKFRFEQCVAPYVAHSAPSGER